MRRSIRLLAVLMALAICETPQADAGFITNGDRSKSSTFTYRGRVYRVTPSSVRQTGTYRTYRQQRPTYTRHWMVIRQR